MASGQFPRLCCIDTFATGLPAKAYVQWRRRKCDFTASTMYQEIYDVVQSFTRMEDQQDLEEPQSTVLGPVFWDDRGSYILQSLIFLAETLAVAKAAIYGDLTGSSWSWEETESVRELLVEVGWCLKDLETFVEMTGPGSRVTVLFFVSNIRRTVFGKDHVSCSLKACVYATYVQNSYKTVHATSMCTCAHFTLKDSNQYPINAILRQRTIPLISIPLGDKSNARIDLTESVPTGQRPIYVARSHV